MKKKFVPGIASVVGVSILLTGCGSYKNEASGANAKDEAPSKQVCYLHQDYTNLQIRFSLLDQNQYL